MMDVLEKHDLTAWRNSFLTALTDIQPKAAAPQK